VDVLSARRLVFFDLDGVLVDSNELKVDCLRQSLADLPADVVDAFAVEFKLTFGRSRREHFAALYRDHLGFHDQGAAFETFYDRYAGAYASLLVTRYVESEVCEHAPRLLRSLAGKGVAMWVVTGTVGTEAEHVLSAAGLRGLFDAVRGGEQPKARHIASGLLHEGIAPADAVLIGDSRHDRLAADEAGIDFLFVPRYAINDIQEVFGDEGSRSGMYVPDLDPDARVASYRPPHEKRRPPVTAIRQDAGARLH
jgi:phosphoglycolate phosphatase-like HAD superfamily hydrolase